MTAGGIAELAAAREAFVGAYGDNPLIARFLAAVDSTIVKLSEAESARDIGRVGISRAYVATASAVHTLNALLADGAPLRVGEALVLNEVVHQRSVIEAIIRDEKQHFTRQWRVVHRLTPDGREIGGAANMEIQFRARLGDGAWFSGSPVFVDGWRKAELTMLDLHTTVTTIIPASEVMA